MSSGCGFGLAFGKVPLRPMRPSMTARAERMNSRDRAALAPVLSALRAVHKPVNPMDIQGVVRALDGAVKTAKTAALQVIEDHRQCPYYSSRFGGGLPNRDE